MSSTTAQAREPLNTRQRSILVAFYDQNPYPSSSERQQLVQVTGRTTKQVQDWFSNRRRTDPRLTSGKSTASSLPHLSPPPSTTMVFPTAYCFTPSTQAPPANFCSCCYPPPMIDPAFYYYPPSVNYFHCSS